jgi:hypothetical protein
VTVDGAPGDHGLITDGPPPAHDGQPVEGPGADHWPLDAGPPDQPSLSDAQPADLPPSPDAQPADLPPSPDAQTADLPQSPDAQPADLPPSPDAQPADLPQLIDAQLPDQSGPCASLSVTVDKATFLARGGPLTDAQALAMVCPAAEIRPGNAAANATFPTASDLQTFYAQDSWGGVAAQAEAYRKMITGQPGQALSTDEIIQWAAHKWGIDENVMRAVAVTESWWKQSATGDWTTDFSKCPPGAATRTQGGSTECAQSYGLMQMKWIYHGKNVWPLSRDSTPFNVEYLACHYRAVMDGYFTWLGNITPQPGYPAYPTGTMDEMFWGAVGEWYSGSWYSSGALNYISTVKNHLAQQTWTLPTF